MIKPNPWNVLSEITHHAASESCSMPSSRFLSKERLHDLTVGFADELTEEADDGYYQNMSTSSLALSTSHRAQYPNVIHVKLVCIHDFGLSDMGLQEMQRLCKQRKLEVKRELTLNEFYSICESVRDSERA